MKKKEIKKCKHKWQIVVEKLWHYHNGGFNPQFMGYYEERIVAVCTECLEKRNI